MISDTWDYEERAGSAKNAMMGGRLFLFSCLKECNYAMIAESDGKFYGAIMGTCFSKPNIGISDNYRSMCSEASDVLASSENGRIFERYYNCYHRLNETILSRSGEKFDGEITFFAVTPESRGLGIGKRLISGLMDYFRKNDVGPVYIFTDTFCSYGFYDKMGFERIIDVSIMDEIGAFDIDTMELMKFESVENSDDIHFFMYKYDLKRHPGP